MFAPPSPSRSSSRTNSDAFIPARVVVLSQLDEREKEQYIALILKSNALIHFDNNHARFVANLRIHGTPTAQSTAAPEAAAATDVSSGKGPRSNPQQAVKGKAAISAAATSVGDKATVDLTARLRRLMNPMAREVAVKVALTAKAPMIDRTRFAQFCTLIADDGYVARYSHKTRLKRQF